MEVWLLQLCPVSITSCSASSIKSNYNSPVISTTDTTRSYLFVCLALAAADGSLADKEREVIKRKLAQRDRCLDCDAVLEDVLATTVSMQATELWPHIETCCREVCHTDADRQALLHDLEEIMEADDVVKQRELDIYRHISLLLQ
jgi:propanediol dehydratase small subunit